VDEADDQQRTLLRPRHEGPSRRAAEESDEFPPFQFTNLHALPQSGIPGSIA
jgi:hypothetical protein